MPSVSIFGIGRMGGALAIALTRAGGQVDHLIHRGTDSLKRIADELSAATLISDSRSIPAITSDIVLITTPDPEIEHAAETLQPFLDGRSVVLHSSGSLSSDVLLNLARAGHPTGSMHPLVSISDAKAGSHSFSGVYFCVEGDDIAREAARELALSLGGHPFSIETDRKPLYHAAAVTAAGHVTALIDVAIEMLSECGVDRSTAQQVLLPLIKSTVANLDGQSPQEALTGTFARADVAAFERHLSSMEGVTPDDIRNIYLLLGERSVELAGKNGVDPVALGKLRESISLAKRKSE